MRSRPRSVQGIAFLSCGVFSENETAPDDCAARGRGSLPGNTEAEYFDNAVRMTFIAAKEQMQRREAQGQKAKSKKRQERKP
jgi:hypothetical protein